MNHLKGLPENFTRRDLIQHVIKNGYGVGRADQLIELATHKGEIVRIRPGVFRKVAKSEQTYDHF